MSKLELTSEDKPGVRYTCLELDDKLEGGKLSIVMEDISDAIKLSISEQEAVELIAHLQKVFTGV